MFWRGWPNFWIFPSADVWEVQPYNRLVVARSEVGRLAVERVKEMPVQGKLFET